MYEMDGLMEWTVVQICISFCDIHLNTAGLEAAAAGGCSDGADASQQNSLNSGDMQNSPSLPFCKRFERTTFLFYLLNNIEGTIRCCQLYGGLAGETIPPPAQQWSI